MSTILDRVKSGERARLIPAIADSKKEERATSILLAIMGVVPDFAKAILSQVGVTVGKRSEVSCYTEVVFRDAAKNLRPDGLIVVKTGSKEWSALIESKIGNANLKQDQLDDYVMLCREVGADALITISNQFALRPDHHPLFIPRKHLKYVDVAHFSWLSIISHSLLSIREHWVTDVEQTFLMRELIRFLEHESSGVSKSVKMGSSWAQVVSSVQMNEKLKKSPEIEDAIAGWHQLLRFLSIQLTMETGRYVSLVLTRQRQRDPDLNFREDVDQLVKENMLTAEFDVPLAASRITLKADFARRTIEASARVSAPGDRSRPKACIDWFVRQIREAQELDPIVRIYWPRSPIPSTLKLSEIESMGTNALISESRKKVLPSSFEVAWVVDLGARFKGTSTFVDDVTGVVPRFFEVVLDGIKAWVPKKTESGGADEVAQSEPERQQPLLLPAPTAQPEAVEPPKEVFRIVPVRERRYLDDRYN